MTWAHSKAPVAGIRVTWAVGCRPPMGGAVMIAVGLKIYPAPTVEPVTPVTQVREIAPPTIVAHTEPPVETVTVMLVAVAPIPVVAPVAPTLGMRAPIA